MFSYYDFLYLNMPLLRYTFAVLFVFVGNHGLSYQSFFMTGVLEGRHKQFPTMLSIFPPTVVILFIVINNQECFAYECGRPAVHLHQNRIVGGSPATPGSLPWTAMLAELGEQVCGGSIISDRLILTAAHCFEDPESMNPSRWKVYAGKYHVDRRDAYETVHYIESIIMHEAYDGDSVANDIAILVLRDRIQFNSMVKPVCLPTPSLPFHIEMSCIAAGWGDTKGTGDDNVLNMVSVPLLDPRICRRVDWYGTDFIPNLTFCAGYANGGKDSCTGDSGGPYVCSFGSIWYQMGVTSWGYDCAKARWPGIYTNVTLYLPWIHHKASNLGIRLQ